MCSLTYVSGKTGEAFSLKGGKVGCLLLHGLTGTTWAMRELGDALHEQGLTVHAPLFPGHRTSASELAGTPWEMWFEHSERALTELRADCQEVFVVGHSMGGALSLLLAASHDVQGTVAISTPYRLRRREVFLTELFRSAVRNWKKHNGDEKHLLPDEGYNVYPLQAVHQLILLLRAFRSNIAAVQCPVLVIHARKDRTVPVHNARRIYNALPAGKKYLEILPGKAHMTTRGETREAVYPFLRVFIKEHSRIKSIRQ